MCIKIRTIICFAENPAVDCEPAAESEDGVTGEPSDAAGSGVRAGVCREGAGSQEYGGPASQGQGYRAVSEPQSGSLWTAGDHAVCRLR